MSCRAALAVYVFAHPAIYAQTSPPHDLSTASLEDLMNIEVTSVSRKEQPLSKAGAAIFVITQEEIHRSGATNIPDVLRMAPGVNVAQIDANAWAISIRGFNSRYSDKILVLIDGRSIYSPAFSGVYWDEINVPLEDIERIEVIRGPGGTVWGANAVNGVINIITFPSHATQGGLIVAGVGSQESGGLAQYGGKAGSEGTHRAFGSYSNTDSSVNPGGSAAADGWHDFHGGFRADLDVSPRDTMMIQGDLFQSGEGQTLTTVLSDQLPAVATFNDPITVGSGDFQARWSHVLANGSELSLNLYFNRVNRLDQGLIEDSKSFDFDLQHHIALNSRNDLVWGLGYRVTNDKLTSGYDNTWIPRNRTDALYSTFVQDEIALAKGVSLTVGTKLEHNAYTGFEYEPSAQLVWTPGSRQTIWLSASQAIRQPSRQDTDIQVDEAIVPLPAGAVGVLEFQGNKDIQPEQLRDYEIGYRAQVTKRFSLSLAMFRSYYRHLETSQPEAPYLVETPALSYLVLPYLLEGAARARSYGGETFATWNVTNRWRLSPAYSLLHIGFLPGSSDQNSSVTAVSGDAPSHQIQIRSTFALRSNLDWDTSLYFIGKISDEQIPSYTRLDMQVRWRVLENVEFSATGQNLLSAHHMEFGDAYGIGHTEVSRSALGKLTWRF